jgi:CHAT domain-containing protein
VQPLAGPTAEVVLGQLENHDIIHFACHGSSNIFDPSESCLLLQRCPPGKVEPEPDPLTVRQVAHLRLVMARIAFLSACSTAEAKLEQVADEVIHLASGFQVAGFAHVIGSLWSSADRVCVAIAEGFYRRLTARKWNKIQDRDVAFALHQSILEVRSQGRN